MKTTAKVLDILLWIAVGLAAAFLVFALARFYLFPTNEYDQKIAELQSGAETLRADTDAAYAELDAAKAAMDADISLAGEAGTALSMQLDDQRAEKEKVAERISELTQDIEDTENLYDRTLAMRTAYGETIRQLEDKIEAGESDVKICYLTLDDGPTIFTAKFLDALAENGAYVTCFTSHEANDVENEDELLRLEMMGGHTVANHTYSHQFNANVYSSLESFKEQVQKQDEFVYDATGFHTDIFRFPAGSGWARGLKDDCIAALTEMGYGWIDWSGNSYDSGTNLPDANSEAGNIVYQVSTMDICVMLCHDWNYNSLEAIKMAIPQLQKKGYVFLPLLPQSSTLGNTTPHFG